MATGDALSTHTFGVQLGGILVESVQEVSGLSVEQEVVEVKQVTNSGEQIIRKQTVNNGAVNTARQNLTIEIMDSTKATVRRIQLMQGWASKWEGPSLKAG